MIIRIILTYCADFKGTAKKYLSALLTTECPDDCINNTRFSSTIIPTEQDLVIFSMVVVILEQSCLVGYDNVRSLILNNG